MQSGGDIINFDRNWNAAVDIENATAKNGNVATTLQDFIQI